jgi:hypothetical protein
MSHNSEVFKISELQASTWNLSLDALGAGNQHGVHYQFLFSAFQGNVLVLTGVNCKTFSGCCSAKTSLDKFVWWAYTHAINLL